MGYRWCPLPCSGQPPPWSQLVRVARMTSASQLEAAALKARGAGWKRGWLQPAKGKQKYLLSCKDKLTRSCLPHKAGMTLTWGRGSITSSPHSPGSAPPTSGLGAGQKPCPSSFLPRPSPLRSEVSNRDPFPPFLLSSHPTPPILSSFLV